ERAGLRVAAVRAACLNGDCGQAVDGRGSGAAAGPRAVLAGQPALGAAAAGAGRAVVSKGGGLAGGGVIGSGCPAATRRRIAVAAGQRAALAAVTAIVDRIAVLTDVAAAFSAD